MIIEAVIINIIRERGITIRGLTARIIRSACYGETAVRVEHDAASINKQMARLEADICAALNIGIEQEDK